ncbi:hypothetical protein [Nonomuraea jabiensis]|uniref:hypothetical protein n=1 Tax=Nonomuraea jabiensis TaxID=882448 RepID=UPI003D735B0B
MSSANECSAWFSGRLRIEAVEEAPEEEASSLFVVAAVVWDRAWNMAAPERVSGSDAAHGARGRVQKRDDFRTDFGSDKDHPKLEGTYELLPDLHKRLSAHR